MISDVLIKGLASILIISKKYLRNIVNPIYDLISFKYIYQVTAASNCCQLQEGWKYSTIVSLSFS